ncbi:MAG: type II CRISPR RNA-guided endonuclease Cas9, partial [Candidatus Limimorpha sp.]
MKKILGLDLGTNSIGWAVVNEAENAEERSSIVRLGVRVIKYDNFVSTTTGKESKDPEKDFNSGKGISPNAGRTLKRSMRRNLQRYKLRRQKLIEIMKKFGIIDDRTILAETGKATTFQTCRLRAKAATEEISLSEFARVLLMINKKRGYKSSRKAKGSEDGTLIDGMAVAQKLYDENLTPGQYCLQLLRNGKKHLPDFYRSDLQAEFDKIWNFQKQFYPTILTDELYYEVQNKNEKQTWAILAKPFNLVGVKRLTKGEELKKETYEWRSQSLSEQFGLEELAVVLQKINAQINASSGYLGAISDRSKELFFNHQTVGQYQMAKLSENPHYSLKNHVFYRQDYLDEFETIWETQAKFHKVLTPELKHEIRDDVIFYQRPLKSCKGLISFCEFESRQIEIEKDGKKKMVTIGSRVIPRSSPLFQEFKIWQTLNNVEISINGMRKNKRDNMPTLFDDSKEDKLNINGHRSLFPEEKERLAKELFVREKMSKTEVLKLLFENPQELDLNFKTIDGNRTGSALFQAYNKIIEISGHDLIDFKKSAEEIIHYVKTIFGGLGWNTDILEFDSDKELDSQPFYKLWHLLYSFEGDKTKTGNENLIGKLMSTYGFDKDSATILANVTFIDDYGSLSAKAIRKILPHMKEGNGYDVACVYAGYGKHSKSSLTKEEIANKILKDKLDILPKNSLRNPVVEKILNQMVHVVNGVIEAYGKPDEIRIELARELKKSAKEREELSKSINETTKIHEQYCKILREEF